MSTIASQLKIGFFTDTYFPQINGVSYTIQLWKQRLEERGHRVLLAYPRGNYQARSDEHGLPAVDLPFYKGYRVGIPNHLSLPNDFAALDLVHIHSTFSLGIVGAYLAHRNDLPLVASFHTRIEDYLDYVTENESLQRLLEKGYCQWERWLLKRCQLITAPSEDAMSEIRDKLGTNSQQNGTKTLMVPNGINTQFFSPHNSQQFKEKYGITADNVIGCTGRHSLGKNLGDLIAVADWFADEYEGQILIAGEGPETERYKELAGGQDNIKFLPFFDRQELPAFYSCLDFFVFPSTIETEGLAALEANACGTPVIGARAGGLQDKIKDGKNGFLFSPRDIEQLKQTLKKGYDQLKSNKKLVKQSREVALSHSVDSSLDQIETEYKRLL